MFHSARRISHLLVAMLLVSLASIGWASVDVPPEAYGAGALHDGDHRVQSRLIVSAEQVKPGDAIRVGVAFKIDPKWHIYWQNPGDAGIPTDIQWESDALEFGPLEWAAPGTFAQGDVTSYGYDNEVVLYSEATVKPSASGEIQIRAKVDYLACHDMCLPGHSALARTIAVGDTTIDADPRVLDLMKSSQERVPRRASEVGLSTTFHYSQNPLRAGDVFDVVVELIECAEAGDDCRAMHVVYDEPSHALLTDRFSAARVESVAVRKHPTAHEGWVLHLKGRMLDALPMPKSILSGVVRLELPDGSILPVHLRDELTTGEAASDVTALALPAWAITDTEPKTGDGADSAEDDAVDAAVPDVAHEADSAAPSLIWTLLMAFFGGMILNLMPCVFPVLVLKVSSFATLAHESRKDVLAHGMSYTGGIVASMMLLAAVVIGLRLTGTQVGWGFQFQQPYFLVALIVILVLFSMNLLGVFEITVSSQKLTESADAASGNKRSFMEGVLAVVLATPCSAPFMGAAVGFALAGSAATIIGVFLALALGLAAPMVVLTLVPGWARLLPQPGYWMVYLKTFLGFALIGSAIWIVWLLGRQVGVDGMGAMLMFAGLLSMATWLYGLVQFQSWGRRKVLGLTAAVLVLGVGAYLAFPLPVSAGDRNETVVVGDVEWKPWSEEAVQEALANGQPVFVDFTADWCITCKVNKKNAIQTQPVSEAVARYNVATFRADWTHENEEIRLKLEEFNRAGIPFYLVYSPKKPNEPKMLAEVITSGNLVDAFREAAK